MCQGSQDSHNSQSPPRLRDPEAIAAREKVLDLATVPTLHCWVFEQFSSIAPVTAPIGGPMLGVSRKLVDRRWRLPRLAAWAKLIIVAEGLRGYHWEHVVTQKYVPIAGAWMWTDPPYDLPGEDWLELCGLSILAATAFLSLCRIRWERRRGLSPVHGGAFWVCVVGLEGSGVAMWALPTWNHLAVFCPPGT